MSGREHFDVIVVGGNVAGLTVAHFVSQWGYRVALVEKAPQVGGVDQSFRNANGRIFDFGLHALDYMRSELTSKLFETAVDGEFYEIERSRGIVLRNHQILYDTPASEWPDELRRMLPEGEIVDDIGSAPPSRSELSRVYGAAFADLAYDEMLASYPTEATHCDFGIDESRLMVNMYPWFFPKARRGRVETTLSRSYQDRVRSAGRDSMLYPKEGGFGGFALGFRRMLEARGVDVITGASDLRVEWNAERAEVESIETGGRRLSAPRVFWCGAAPALYDLLSLPKPDFAPDSFVLGSFEFEDEISCEFTELILGDPEHPINRLSFPGRFQHQKDNLVSVEFAFPAGSTEYETKAPYWLERWTRSLTRLGIVSPNNRVVDFDLKVVGMIYNSFGSRGTPVSDLSDLATAIPPESNLKPVLPTLLKVNINSRVPAYLRFLAEEMTR